MKILFTVLFGLLSYVSFSQVEYSKYVMKDSLSTSLMVKENSKAMFNNVEIKLEEVLEDSRCPKDVMCIRAGEAKINVNLYQGGKLLESKLIIIPASGVISKTHHLIFENEDFSLYAFKLSPYPDTKSTVETRDYELEVLLQSKVKN